MGSNILLLCVAIVVVSVQAKTVTLSRSKRSTCPATKQCLEEVPMLEEYVFKDNAKALFSVSYATLLDHVCSKKDALDTCLGNTYCRDVEIRYIGTGVQQVMNYICGDGRDSLLSESKCFARDGFELGFKMCAKAMESESLIVALGIQGGWQSASDFCPSFTKYFKCVDNEAKNHCSETAADFVTTLAAKVVEPLAKQIGCTLTY